jgi:formate-dependent nitrite reductase membrane component NrfD
MNSAFDPQFQPNDPSNFARNALRGVPAVAHSGVVNRTHRVVRERAKILQQQRNRERSLMVPLTICSVLLTLSVLAVWTGMYQYQAVEAVEADVTALATTDNNHFLVILLWFVPVSIAVLTTVWVRRSRNNADDEAL